MLRDNLQELSTAVHHGGGQISLISNYSGSRIYHAATGWGRIWRWIYDLLRKLKIDPKQDEKLHHAILKTQETYAKYIENLESSLQKYSEYLQQKSLGIETAEESYHPARKNILSWKESTKPFLKLFDQTCRERFSKWTVQNGFENFSFFTAPKMSADLRSICYLIRLETHLKGPLPLDLFRKLACGEALNDKESRNLLKWIEKNNQENSPLKIEHFHSALVSFIHQARRHSENSSADLYRLELALTDLGLKVFQNADPHHMQWREDLNPGDLLGKNFILKERIGEKSEKDKTYIFSIKDEPEKVAVIASNRALLGMKKRIEEENGWGIPHGKMLHLDSEGRFAIYEKLVDSIEKRQWNTEKVWVSLEDEDLLIPIENMLQWMLQKEISPVDLDSKYLMFDTKGVLRYSKVCLPGEFNLTGMEEFIFKCSKGVQKIYIHLMEKSKLYAHSSHEFYLQMMESSLKNSKKDASDTAAILSISDPRIVDRGEALYNEVSQMKETCFQIIALKYAIPDTEKLKEEIRKQIRSFYIQTRLMSLLWPTMHERVVESVLKKMPLASRL